ncbi:MAG: hypothetical protein EBT09_06535 [Actinobacteria bacterium]|nr:hypothetical protein [Actinomycetota bacterium]
MMSAWTGCRLDIGGNGSATKATANARNKIRGANRSRPDTVNYGTGAHEKQSCLHFSMHCTLDFNVSFAGATI